MKSLKQALGRACARFRAGDPAIIADGVALAEYIRQRPDRSPGVLPEDAANEPYIIGNIAGQGVAFRRFLANEALWVLAANLLDVRREDIVYHYGQVLRKPAHIGPALSWHRDYANTYIFTQGSACSSLTTHAESIRFERWDWGCSRLTLD